MIESKKHNKHNNQVRIIGGKHRGRKLTFADAEGLRPTADMVRERLFNWLGQDLTGYHVLDLFAGSGVLGFEAASRNAKKVILVENNRTTVHTLRKNAQLLQCEQLNILNADGIQYLKQSQEQFHAVFLDPPFAWKEWHTLFPHLKNCLHQNAWVYLEAATLPEIPNYFEIFRQGKSGKSQFVLLKFTNHSEE